MSFDQKLPTVSEIIIVKPTSKPQGEYNTQNQTSKPLTQTTQSSSDGNHKSQPQGEEEIVEIENVTLKFRLKGNQTIAQIYPNCMTLAEVKTDIARRFEVEPELLLLKQGSQILSDVCSIRETDIDEYGIYEYQLELNVKLKPLKYQNQSNDNNVQESDIQPKLDLNVYYRC